MTGQDVQSGSDIVTARLVEELTDRLHAAGDVEAFIAAHPDHAATLRRLLPAALVMADLSRSAAAGPDGDVRPPAEDLGDFRIVREVGRGGMGVVYEADQVSLGRRVALKVLPFAATMDPKQLQRFKNEAKAAASLYHEHIVHVYGVGCERGVHFFAMQFVDGHTLADVITAGTTRKGPTPADNKPGSTSATCTDASPGHETRPIAFLSTERAGLRAGAFFRRCADMIADAADALEHAHSLGIVHRDIKPGNLLLDHAGKIYVSDFGLARFGPDAGLTMTGDLLGTLRYMAPEQALAKHGLVDHRADVYGLGATLYELLTGKPVVGGEDKQEILRRLAFEEPVPPRKVDKAIPAELETITLKCLAKEPTERYATAGELAADLRRFCQDRPIKAKPPTLWQRSARRLRRHPKAMSTVFAMAVLAAAGALTSLYLIDRQKQRAEAALARSRLALDELSDEVIFEWLAKQAELTDEHKQFLQRMLGHYEWLARQPGTDSQIGAGLARANLRIGNIRWKLGQTAEAEMAFIRAIELNRQLADRFPTEPGFVENLAVVHRCRAKVLQQIHRFTDAESEFKEVLVLNEQLADQYPSKLEYRYELAETYLEYGDLLKDGRIGTPSEAEESYRRGLGYMPGLPSARPDCQSLLARLNLHLGDLYYERMGRPTEAKQCLDLGIELLDRLLESPASENKRVQYLSDLANGLTHLGHDLGSAGLGRPEEASAADRRAVSIWEGLVADFPSVPDYRFHLALGLHALGNHLGTDLNRFEEGVTQYRRAISVLEKLAADYPKQPNYQNSQVMVMHRLMQLFKGKDQIEDAERTARQALAIVDRLAANYPAAIHFQHNKAVSLSGLGVILCDKLGTPVEAETVFRQAIALEPGEATFHANLGIALTNQRRCKAAEAEFRQALVLRPDLLRARYGAACAVVLAGAGQSSDAETRDEAEPSQWRQKALDWLTAEFAAYAKLANKPAARPMVQQTMQHWLNDTDLAGVRDAAALANLPEAERVAWQKLWADVAALQKRCEEQPPAKEPPPKP